MQYQVAPGDHRLSTGGQQRGHLALGSHTARGVNSVDFYGTNGALVSMLLDLKGTPLRKNGVRASLEV